ncbi:chemotaxis protein CheA [Methylicorpusculum sp.]|uniref:chemotaxis protein CheA n=1 Tax=Methylicorpusculum sp. TaxID=2713644 RepID=UPI00271DB064|nr:chemotaxis protein CheA [Methylicorpusculum sp.]MDO8844847.1 chemotaxis protein CheA [Methylicorpusculum sp.]
MNPLLEQFLSEARELLQGIAEKLLQLEKDPDSTLTMNELFRLVHTLKGNSGLFEFYDMIRVLHAGEDLLDAVRDGRLNFSQLMADRLLDAMDFVVLLIDEIEANGSIGINHGQSSVQFADSLRQLIGSEGGESAETASISEDNSSVAVKPMIFPGFDSLGELPEELLMNHYRHAVTGGHLWLVEYTPEEECFYKGEDPFFQIRQIPEAFWQSVQSREPWSPLIELDAYRCNLAFHVLTTTTSEELLELFRYTPEQIRIVKVPAMMLVLPQGDPNGGPVYGDFVTDALGLLQNGDIPALQAIARTMLELSSPSLWVSSALRWLLLLLEIEPDNGQAHRILVESLRTLTPPDWLTIYNPDDPDPVAEQKETTVNNAFTESDLLAFNDIMHAQREILSQPDSDAWLQGRLSSVAATLAAIHKSVGRTDVLPSLDEALTLALQDDKAAPLLAWLDSLESPLEKVVPDVHEEIAEIELPSSSLEPVGNGISETDTEVKFGRRAEDAYTGPKTLKVDQVKIDRLMGLIGEMVVAKNSLPYLASRAENQYGVREIAREIKTQYAVINRIAEEMQDAIMQVRMMPVSFIFQRFPRLVRDISRKLGKDVTLILDGEDTEADKNIVEALADPLIHIVRNSLDHGIESPEVRKAAGKPKVGRLTIRASQEADRVYIEISDDGKGINAQEIKRKAYEKGVIDEATMERLSEQDSLNLVFAAGFSTAEVISDLSGRGVGMDVVRSAIEKVNGTINLESEVGKGTRIRLSLPLSMAVTNVMIVEFDNQIFGVPMDMVVETVRVPNKTIRTIKKHLTTVLRGRIVPLLALNELLGMDTQPRANEENEMATLVVRINDEHVGIMVDDFRETVDIILKPMAGILGGLGGYSGSALLGDGSVLMVLNPKELI